MTEYVAFLRAVNLGKRTVRMARLVEVFEDLGYRAVSTYINSGNVMFDGEGRRADLEAAIEAVLAAEFGFEVTTFLRTSGELKAMVSAAPFVVAESDTYFITFLKSPPNATTRRALEELSNKMDTLVVKGRDVHWRMHGKSTDSSLKSKDWAVVGKNNSTSRNITMLRKLILKIDG